LLQVQVCIQTIRDAQDAFRVRLIDQIDGPFAIKLPLSGMKPHN